jgi:hypothetical protein
MIFSIPDLIIVGPMLRARLAIAAVSLVAAWPAAAQGPLTLDDVVRRVADYVVDYQRRLVGIVAEEHYRQNVYYTTRGGRSSRQFRELKSDLLLVRTPDDSGWLQFRDTFEVDRKPVRDREDRLYKLFVTPTETMRSRAAVIMEESSRYNIGPVTRTINMPILGILFFHPENRPQLKLERLIVNNVQRFAGLAKMEDVWRIGFVETGSPTMIKGTKNGDLKSRGEIWVDGLTGRILRTQVISEDVNLRAEIAVTYKAETGVAMLVPAEMRETYRLGVNQTNIDGRAQYSKFRQFTVTTTEKPKQ